MVTPLSTNLIAMPNPNALYEDMQKLDDMYEELLWHPDDELQFSHDGEKIIITNKTLENKQWNLVLHLRQRSSTPALQCSVSWLLLALTLLLDKFCQGYSDVSLSSIFNWIIYIMVSYLCWRSWWRWWQRRWDLNPCLCSVPINTIEYRRRKDPLPRNRRILFSFYRLWYKINFSTFITRQPMNQWWSAWQ